MQWIKQAECRGVDVQEFFENFERSSLDERMKLIRMCGKCSVREQCFAYASSFRETEGFWAGHYWRRGRPVNPVRIKTSDKPIRLSIKI